MTAVETEWSAWALRGLLCYGNQQPSLSGLALCILSQPNNKIPARDRSAHNGRIQFLKVIKFYDFFMCLPLLGLTSFVHDMLLSSLFHRLPFLHALARAKEKGITTATCAARGAKGFSLRLGLGCRLSGENWNTNERTRRSAERKAEFSAIYRDTRRTLC